MPAGVIQTCITSPPYWGLRDYGVDGQLGLESTPDEYVAKIVEVFREVRRVLRDDGTLWLNLGDSYTGGGRAGKDGIQKWGGIESGNQSRIYGAPMGKINGCKPKDLVGIPWLVAFALRADGWYLRSDIIWSKPNPMPESVKDRPTKAHEYLFLLAKSQKYYYDGDAIRQPYNPQTFDRNKHPKAVSTSPGRHKPGNTDERFQEQHIQPLNPLGANKRSVWDRCHSAMFLCPLRYFSGKADRALYLGGISRRRDCAGSVLWYRNDRQAIKRARAQLHTDRPE